jgi:hypothetical protein
MAYILKAPSLSKLAPGDMYYTEGRWTKDETQAEVFKLKKDATAAAKRENESASSVHDVEVIKLEK